MKLTDTTTLYSFRHNKNKKAKQHANNKLGSEDSISTVMEEDEEMGRNDSERGLQSLLDDVGVLLESNSGSVDGSATDGKFGSGTGGASTRSGKSIQEKLEAIDAPTELRQATALLLQSSLLDETTALLLTSDILEQPLDDESNSVEDDRDEMEVDVSAAVAGADEEESVDQDDEIVPTEASALLSPSTRNEEMLRPSIFTMLSSEDLHESE